MTAPRRNPYPGLTHLRRGETEYPREPDPAILETFANEHTGNRYWVTLDCPEFTSLCPVTGQPDFGHITIRYMPDRHCLESKSLKLYLFAFRNEQTFHESAVNRIAADIIDACHPSRLEVEGRFKPRGGISITVKTEHQREA